MTGKHYGSAESTNEQKVCAQEDTLKAAERFGTSGKVSRADVTNRAKLTLLIEVIGPGDTGDRVQN